MITHHYQQARFITSAAKLAQLPPDNGIEVAFAGRSNAGKSSALNTITHQKKLAHTSKTPGRTQLINYFEIAPDKYLVDLPGYGYAKVSESIKLRWQETLARYLETRESLRGLILVMDIRHPLKDMDRTMIEWAYRSEIDTHILLTKADKLSRNQANKTLQTVKKELKPFTDRLSIQIFSSSKRIGVEEVHEVMDAWFDTTLE